MRYIYKKNLIILRIWNHLCLKIGYCKINAHSLFAYFENWCMKILNIVNLWMDNNIPKLWSLHMILFSYIWVFVTETVYFTIFYSTTLVIFVFKFFRIFVFQGPSAKIFNGTATNVIINSTCYFYGVFYLCGRFWHFESNT